jgi:hypothetical protein
MSELSITPPRNIGVTFNPLHEGARELAHQLVDAIKARGVAVALDDETSAADELADSDLVI